MNRSTHVSGALALLLFAAGLPWQALAADESPAAAAGPSPTAAKAPAETERATLQEIVVTANRREESLSKVPISVSALTRDAMDDRGIKDFQDLARFIPGV